jgi:hypothetical protein
MTDADGADWSPDRPGRPAQLDTGPGGNRGARQVACLSPDPHPAHGWRYASGAEVGYWCRGVTGQTGESVAEVHGPDDRLRTAYTAVLDRAARLRVDVEVHEADKWSAVYLDGKLVRQATPYLANEWVRAHFGVVTVQDDAFLRGGSGAETAQTLDEVAAYARTRRDALDRAVELERQAEALIDEAQRLRQQRQVTGR